MPPEKSVTSKSTVLELKAAGITLTHIDLGGGIGIPYGQEDTPLLDAYAEVAKRETKDLGCQLVFEPGRVLVGNAGRLKAGIEAFPGATPTDGLVHVAIVTATGLRQWGGILAAAAVRKPEWSRNALLNEGTEIIMEFPKKQHFELDGGVKTRAKRLEFKVRPRSLHVVAPAMER